MQQSTTGNSDSKSSSQIEADLRRQIEAMQDKILSANDRHTSEEKLISDLESAKNENAMLLLQQANTETERQHSETLLHQNRQELAIARSRLDDLLQSEGARQISEEARVSEMRQQIKSLQLQISNGLEEKSNQFKDQMKLTSQLEISAHQIKTLESEVAKQEKLRDEVQSALSSSEDTLENLRVSWQAELSQKRQEVEHMTQELYLTKAQLAEEKSQNHLLASAEARAAKYEDINGELASKNSTLSVTNATLLSENATLKVSNDQSTKLSEASTALWQPQIASFQKQIMELMESRNNLSTQHAIVHAESQTMEKELRRLLQSEETLQDEVRILDEKARSLESEHHKLNAEIIRKDATLSAQAERLALVKQKALLEDERMIQVLADLREQTGSLNIKLQTVVGENLVLQRNNVRLEEVQANLSNTLSDEQRRLQNSEDALLNTRNQLNSKTTDFVTLSQQSASRIANLDFTNRDILAELQEEREVSARELESSKQVMAALQDSMKGLQDEIYAERGQQDQLMKEISTTKDRLAESELALSEARHQNTFVQANLTSEQARADGLGREIEAAKAKHVRELNALNATVEELKSQNQSLLSRNNVQEDALREFDQRYTQLDASTKARDAAQEQAIESHRKRIHEIEDSMRKLQQVEKKLAEQLNVSQSQKNELAYKIQAITNAKEQNEANHAKLIDNYKEHQAYLKKVVEQKTVEIGEMQNLCKDLQDRLDSSHNIMSAFTEETSAKFADLHETIITKSNEQIRLEVVQSELLSDLDNAQSQISLWRKKYEDATDGIHTCLEIFGVGNVNLDQDLEIGLQALRASINESLMQIQSQGDALEDLKTQTASRVMSLQSRVQDSDMVSQVTISALNNMQNRLENYIAQHADAKDTSAEFISGLEDSEDFSHMTAQNIENLVARRLQVFDKTLSSFNLKALHDELNIVTHDNMCLDQEVKELRTGLQRLEKDFEQQAYLLRQELQPMLQTILNRDESVTVFSNKDITLICRQISNAFLRTKAEVDSKVHRSEKTVKSLRTLIEHAKTRVQSTEKILAQKQEELEIQKTLLATERAAQEHRFSPEHYAMMMSETISAMSSLADLKSSLETNGVQLETQMELSKSPSEILPSDCTEILKVYRRVVRNMLTKFLSVKTHDTQSTLHLESQVSRLKEDLRHSNRLLRTCEDDLDASRRKILRMAEYVEGGDRVIQTALALGLGNLPPKVAEATKLKSSSSTSKPKSKVTKLKRVSSNPRLKEKV